MHNILEHKLNLTNEKRPYFTWHELLQATKGKWSGIDPNNLEIPGISCVSTDSRSLPKTALYLALRGQRFDGHDFVEQAIKKGASAVCVEKFSHGQADLLQSHAIPCLLVPDTLKALQDIAATHRRRFNLPMIAVTGSSGKTSTKEIIGSILKQQFQDAVLLTHGNTNNQIGVPLNLLKLSAQHRAAVLELGTNTPGEIKTLTKLVVPNCSVLTNVGPVHLEGLKSIEGVIKEKSDIFSCLEVNGECAVLPAALNNHPHILSKTRGKRVITFGVEKNADIRLVYQSGNFNSSSYLIYYQEESHPLEVTWNLSGKYQALNAAASVAIAKFMDINDRTILKALENIQLPKMRMDISWKNNIRWINDAYNANPESMKAFLHWLSTIFPQIPDSSRCYVVLGDMLELGEEEEKYHNEILHYALTELPEKVLLLVGERMSHAADRLGLRSFLKVDDVKKWLFAQVREGDSVALKGSRGIALERIIP